LQDGTVAVARFSNKTAATPAALINDILIASKTQVQCHA